MPVVHNFVFCFLLCAGVAVIPSGTGEHKPVLAQKCRMTQQVKKATPISVGDSQVLLLP